MGSCVSVHKDSQSAMKLRQSFGSKTDELVAIPSPIKDKPVVYSDRPITDIGFKPSPLVANFRGFGSKEETFFDSQPWLESDCEDDFYSVKGDFTPSRGSTPVHPSFSFGVLQVNKAIVGDMIAGSRPELSPTSKKKKLAELFKQSPQNDHAVHKQNTSENESLMDRNTESILPPKSVNGTPHLSSVNSFCSGEITPNINPIHEKKSTTQCCLPRLLPTRSFGEKKMTPASDTG